MNAFLGALQNQSAKMNPLGTTPKKPEVQKPVLVEKPKPQPVEPEEIGDIFLGADFEHYRKEVERLCAHYKCDKADLAVIAVLHLARLIAN